ncbi:MAG: DUF3795 domain-containing protein [Candidatus Bathyarchaeia archaeon]
MNKTQKNLIAYCGLYCGACGLYQGKIKQAVENLRGIMATYGFDKFASELARWEPSFRHYPEFEKVMDGILKLFSECPTCEAGGGPPACPIRECCKPKGYTTCVECPEMGTCEKVQQRDWITKRLKEIKEKGLENWAEEMREKVEKGYCYLDERKS